MNINTINPTNFEAMKLTKFYVPGKNNTTLRCTMESQTKRNPKCFEDITSLKCETLSKGKTIDVHDFHNKKGFSDERLCTIADTIQKKVREGYDFLEELIRAQIHGGN